MRPTSLLVVVLMLGGTVQASAAPAKGFARAASGSSGQKRVALVIGNAAYAQRPLRNPVRDAKAMATSLGALGFEVDARFDLDREGMLRALQDFGAKLDEDTVALFYYSGHGLSHEGRSYMLPTEFRIATDTDVDLEAVDLRRITARLEEAGSRLNIIVLDACRDNPLDIASLRSSAGGLAFVTAPSGTLIAYATAPGRTATDGRGTMSPYTGALVEEMKVPGRTVEATFKAVRRRVREATGGVQVPWESSSLEGRFVFAEDRPAQTAGEAPAPAADGVAAAGSAGRQPRRSDEAPSRAERDRERDDDADAIELLRRRRRRQNAAEPEAASPTPPKSIEERYALTGRQLNNYLIALGCFGAATAMALGATALSGGAVGAASANLLPQASAYVLPLLLMSLTSLVVGSSFGLLTGCCGLATGELFWRHLKLGDKLEEQALEGGKEGAEQGVTAMAY